ncbi:sporulation protein, yteA family [Desulforamulus ruminis DSM 2154]|uniref:Sporulation protein, yteA family n=1 Tax=Desulforamulus ruminis (strain ATCC 23193 / DSM 2154 / NCIMB 8452 / DL) TaxID=696281 RepID=F6DM99_DESRL|nr:sporulation protein, yteA family [Desulforamulus ruminis DSM 2154]
MLSKEQQEDFKRQLLAMRGHMLDRIEGMNEGGLGESMTDSFGELSTYDNHPGDVGTEMFERGKDFALREEAMTTLGAIDDALDKMEKGRYGQCEVCGREIAVDRLEAVPYTTQCVDCKAKDEHLLQPDQRTAEEDMLETPFARSWKDHENYVGFDGEDTWETLAVWNEHAASSRAGSYYGDEEMMEEKGRDPYRNVDNIPYEVGDDGDFYQDFRGTDDERAPYEKIDLGYRHQEPGEKQ